MNPKSSLGTFFSNLRKKRIIEILAAFIGGGWLIIEFVDRILVAHYHFPDKTIDITFITLLCALICTLLWRWFSGREAPRKFKLELILIPSVVLITVLLDINLLLHLKQPEAGAFRAPQWKNSVAVLPFDDISAQKDQESFCDGMTVDLIDRLSNVKDLKVPARTSVFMFKGKTPEPSEVREKLKVQTMVLGSVQRSGNMLRIIAQLINLADGYILWTRRFDKELKDVFDIQDEISIEIADALRLMLTSQEKANLTKRGTSDTAAYELYFKGKQFRYKERPKEMLQARDCFKEAIIKDPDYAAAYAGLAENYMMLGLSSVLPRDEAANEAMLATRKALEIDPNSPEAHVSSGVVKMVFDWDWNGAEKEFKEAIVLNPNNFDAHREYALLLVRNYRYGESEREFLRSIELDPLNGLPFRDLQSVYLMQGRADKADEIRKRLAEIDPYWAKLRTGFELTIEEIERDIKEQGKSEWNLIGLAAANYKLGNIEEAAKLIKDVENLYEEDRQGNVAYMLAYYYVGMLKDRGRSLTWLERAVEGRAPMLINVSRDIRFDFLYEEPRFQEVLRRVGLK
jgi:adenylate cyclase